MRFSSNDADAARLARVRGAQVLGSSGVDLGVDLRVTRDGGGSGSEKQAPWKGFVAGSTGAMLSGAVTHPIDLVKVRMQLYGAQDGFQAASGAAKPIAPPGMLKTGYNVIQHEGALGLYRGLGAGLMRQASFIGTKFGAYDLLKSAVPKDPTAVASFWKMTLCGLGAGAIGAAVGNPADFAMVRMQADGRLPKELRRNYRGGEALARVVREEGVLALWRAGAGRR